MRRKDKVGEFLRENPGREFATSEIADALGEPDRKKIHKTLTSYERYGMCEKCGHVSYNHARTTVWKALP